MGGSCASKSSRTLALGRSGPRPQVIVTAVMTLEPRNETFAPHRCEPNHECPVGCDIQGILTEVYDEVHKGMSERLARSTNASVVGTSNRQIRA